MAPTLTTDRKHKDECMPKTSSSSKLKELVKNKAKALIKVLPKNAVPSTGGEKRDYDTDSSSQDDHVPLLPDYEGSTDEESQNVEEDFVAQFTPIPDHELPVATPVVAVEAPSPKQPQRQVLQKPLPRKTKPTIIRVNVNNHRSKAFYAAAKNKKEAEDELPKEDLFAKFPVLTCQQFPSDVSGVSDNAVQSAKDPMDGMKLVSKAAVLKALQVSGTIIDKGNTLCVETYEKSLKDGAVPCITKAPASIEGAKLEIVSTTTQSTLGNSICSIQQQQEFDCPDDESAPMVQKHRVSGKKKKKSRRRRRHNKGKTRRKGEFADPDAGNEQSVVKRSIDKNSDDDFFLMTVEDIEEIRKMAREYVKESNSEQGTQRSMFGCHQVTDAVEWLLCTSIQGGGRQTMTKKQARTRFADADMQDDCSSMPDHGDTRFADDDMSFSSKGSIDESFTMDNSVVQENDNDDDDDSDDDGDFYFDEQSMNTANKVVRNFRPTGLISTQDMTVVYGGNVEQMEDTIETVLVADSSNKNAQGLERGDCEYGDELPIIANLDEAKLNYDYENYQVPSGAARNIVENPMDAIVCETNEDDECWDNVSIITPHSAHTATYRRLQHLETELVRLQKEYQEITDNNDEEPAMKQICTMEESNTEPDQSEDCDECSIDGPMNAAPQCCGDDKSLRSAEQQCKLATIKMLQEEKSILEKRVKELVSAMEASELCHSKQLADTKKASQAQMEEIRYRQMGALEEANKKIEELEFDLRQSQTDMIDMRAKYSRDLEAAKYLQSGELQKIQNQQGAALEVATSKIGELELNLEHAQMALEELKEKHRRDLEAAERAQLYKVRQREMKETDLRMTLEEVKYQSEKDREESERKVKEIRQEHTKQIEEMIQQLDVVVGEHEKQHAKEYEKLIAQLDLVVAEHEAKCNEMEKTAMEKDALIANLGSQLAAVQLKLEQIKEFDA